MLVPLWVAAFVAGLGVGVEGGFWTALGVLASAATAGVLLARRRRWISMGAAAALSAGVGLGQMSLSPEPQTGGVARALAEGRPIPVEATWTRTCFERDRGDGRWRALLRIESAAGRPGQGRLL